MPVVVHACLIPRAPRSVAVRPIMRSPQLSFEVRPDVSVFLDVSISLSLGANAPADLRKRIRLNQNASPPSVSRGCLPKGQAGRARFPVRSINLSGQGTARFRNGKDEVSGEIARGQRDVSPAWCPGSANHSRNGCHPPRAALRRERRRTVPMPRGVRKYARRPPDRRVTSPSDQCWQDQHVTLVMTQVTLRCSEVAKSGSSRSTTRDPCMTRKPKGSGLFAPVIMMTGDRPDLPDRYIVLRIRRAPVILPDAWNVARTPGRNHCPRRSW